MTYIGAGQPLTLTDPLTHTASFSYDAFGRRTGKTIQGTTTNFVYDGLNPVQEKNGATVTANLLTGLGIDEFFARTDGVGVRALLPDALGSTVALGDNTGTLQTQYTYEPFGFASQTGAASTNSYKFTGREEDGTGLLYYRARYYHPRLQRFISEDPIGFLGGDVNLYGYVLDNPVMRRDPRGLWLPQAIGTVVGMGVGGIGAYINDPNASLQTILQSAAVGGAAGLVSTLPIPGLSLSSSASLLGGIAGAAGNLILQKLLPSSSCAQRTDWPSVAIAGATGAIGGLGGATLASITSKHGMPLLTDLGQQAVSAAGGGTLGGLLDMIFQYQHRLQTGIGVTP